MAVTHRRKKDRHTRPEPRATLASARSSMLHRRASCFCLATKGDLWNRQTDRQNCAWAIFNDDPREKGPRFYQIQIPPPGVRKGLNGKWSAFNGMVGFLSQTSNWEALPRRAPTFPWVRSVATDAPRRLYPGIASLLSPGGARAVFGVSENGVAQSAPTSQCGRTAPI
jgi:hypothetical protein